MTYLLLIIGFFGLIQGANIFISGSIFIANLLKIPKVIIGLTIVAIGVSLPEASISILASLHSNTQLAINNVLGSNFFNLLMVLGVCALIKDIPVHKKIIKKDFPALLFFYVLDCSFFWNGINKIEGIVLLLCFVVYVILLVKYSVNNKVEDDDFQVKSKFDIVKNIFFIILGVFCIKFCGDLVIDNVGVVAKCLGIKSSFVDFTVFAIVAGLPDLIMSIVSLRKKENELVLGSVIGTNILHSTFTLGLVSILSPIYVDKKILLNLVTLLLTAFLVFVLGRKYRKFTRPIGIIFVGIYLTYTLYLFF